MTGDPKVLAPLQRAYLAATNAKVLQRIQIVWDFETSGKIVNNDADADAEIRAWTPPPAEPSLDDLAFGLSIKFAAIEQRVEDLTNRINDEEAVNRRQWDFINGFVGRLATAEAQIKAITKQQHPDPTAPDDPVCLDCGHPKSDHTPNGIVCQRNQSKPEGPHCHCHGYIDPGWKPAPDLDPVRVEAATKALFHTYNPSYGWDDHREWHFKWRQQAEATIRAYLKDGGA